MKTLTSILLDTQSMHHSFSTKLPVIENDFQHTWLDQTTTDAWRHNRMRNGIQTLISSNDSWLTVGDCRFGADAAWLKRFGANVTASDIQDVSLKEAKESNLIDQYLILNMESLALESDSYDYIFCKESLHHLSRPYLGIYEMIRCARKGVVLIEPAGRSPLNQFGKITHAIKYAFNERKIFFEESGNYVFELKKIEIEQILLSLGISRFSYRYLNDDYIQGVETDQMSSLFAKIRMRIWLKDLRDYLFQWSQGMIVVVIHSNEVAQDEINSLADFGFKNIILPLSPLLSKA
jgi:2-polyprenyl-3-methyl-5-hydroxy-6-metoxy-1,4-benzoquinol methylase